MQLDADQLVRPQTVPLLVYQWTKRSETAHVLSVFSGLTFEDGAIVITNLVDWDIQLQIFKVVVIRRLRKAVLDEVGVRSNFLFLLLLRLLSDLWRLNNFRFLSESGDLDFGLDTFLRLNGLARRNVANSTVAHVLSELCTFYVFWVFHRLVQDE